MHLPFEDQQFDVVYSGCVFPHVGVKGDSREVLADYATHRLAIAKVDLLAELHQRGRTQHVTARRRFVVVDHLPRNAMNKIIRTVLPGML